MNRKDEIIEMLFNELEESEQLTFIQRELVRNAMEEYKREACKEQRKICANEIELEEPEGGKLYREVEAIRDRVENAPEPELK